MRSCIKDTGDLSTLEIVGIFPDSCVSGTRFDCYSCWNRSGLLRE